jgi:prepilin peptidase CpaA
VTGHVLLTCLLVAVCISDLRFHRIPNRLIAVIGLAGFAYAFAILPAGRAIVFALGGAGVGLAIWLPFWLLRVLGAGDVKLMAAAGTWLGAVGAVEASLIAAVVGGPMAIWALTRTRSESSAATRFGAWLVMSRLTRSIAPEFTPVEHRIPYGVALAAGAAVAVWFPELLGLR